MATFEEPTNGGTDKSICGTALTIDTVQTVLCKYFATANTISTFTANEVGAGKGFLSIMAQVSMTWAAEDERLPATILVKIPSTIQFDRIKEHAKTASPEVYKIETADMEKELEIFEEFATALKSNVRRVVVALHVINAD